jgi:hypothetical protein
MLQSNLLIILFCAFSLTSYSQDLMYKGYDWEKDPKLHATASSDLLYPAVVINDYRTLELKITSSEGSSYLTEHKIVHVNSNAGVEKFNKVAIPIAGNQQLLSLKVRCVSPDGRITNFQKENLKELQNVNGYANYKIFAVEGLTIGGEVEYLYTVKGSARSYGREILQQDVPVREAILLIVYPEKFEWNVKVYNGASKPDRSPVYGKRESISITAVNVPALKEEQYSAYKANLMRVDYKLESNGRTADMMSWSDLSQRMLKNIYEPDGASRVHKLVASLDLDRLNDPEKVTVVENYVKTNFTLKEGNNKSYEDLKDVLTSHVGNEMGLTKLYMSCWSDLKIPNEIVFASERTEGLLDPDFASPMQVRKILFYFPQFKKFLSPDVAYLRLGAAPEAVGNGLFISYTTRGNALKYIDHSIKDIAPLDYTHNNLGVRAKVIFQDSFENAEINQKNFYQGYRAFQYRGVYAILPNERKEEFMKTVTLSAIENPQVIARAVEGDKMNLSGDPDNYFTIKTTYKTSSLLEKAGDDYLFSIGKLIGRQSELYQESERQTDVAFRSISNYNHEITVTIPEGYQCLEMDKAKMSKSVVMDNDAVMKFESNYELNGNMLTIKINEVYKTLSLPKEKYPEFRSVVNASADFNKVVIILHKRN